MASPFSGLEPQQFARIKDKAVSQLTRGTDTPCDVETMALEIAWLNNRYRGYNVHFALLGASGWDITTFPVPYVKKTFLFHQHQGTWSVAYVKRCHDQIVFFDGTSDKPSHRLDEDQDRAARLQHLFDAIHVHLAQLALPETVRPCQHKIVSHADMTFSATSCLAWAEAKVCRWPIGHNWHGFEHPCWMPAAESCSESVEMVDGGDTDWNDVLQERARQSSIA